MATSVIVKTFGLEQRHIDRLELITEELLRQGRIRDRNRSDVVRLLIEDFSLPNWSIDSTLPKDQAADATA